VGNNIANWYYLTYIKWQASFPLHICTANKSSMTKRIIGFDLARAYAILGMFIVNFNTVFGSHNDQSYMGRFLGLFNGNSSTIFVILAGMGVSLMSNRSGYTDAEKKQLRSVVLKRSWFLFFIGLLLYIWWPADILHFYGGYMHIAALLLFVNRKYYLWTAGIAILIFHLLLLVIDYQKGWNFETLEYTDFWTIGGFLRNTFYNGWNPILPWIAFFMLGMWLGRLNWNDANTRKQIFITGAGIFACMELLQVMAFNNFFSEYLKFYITADYLPPFLPFMLSTAGFGLAVIAICFYIGEKFSTTRWLQVLATTGKMTLTHYIVHLTTGMILLGAINGKNPLTTIDRMIPLEPIYIFCYAILFFILSIAFSYFWNRKFKNGPMEMLMRKITG
jgi:uncharacterized protein